MTGGGGEGRLPQVLHSEGGLPVRMAYNDVGLGRLLKYR